MGIVLRQSESMGRNIKIITPPGLIKHERLCFFKYIGKCQQIYSFQVNFDNTGSKFSLSNNGRAEQK
jgi:hypothetical protein